MMHWHECRCLKPLWLKWLDLLKLDYITALHPMLVYYAIDKGDAIRPILNAAHKIVWKHIIIGLAAKDEDNKIFNPDQVWRTTLWRLITIIRHQAHGIRLLLLRAKARDIINEDTLTNMIAPRNARMRPLAHVALDGELRLHPKLINQLNEAQIKHNEHPINQPESIN